MSVDSLAPAPPARQQVQVWRGGGAVALHAVRVRGDSLSGVPFHLPPSCDTCRVAIAVSAIDSVRVGDQENNFFAVLMGVGIFFLGVAFLASSLPKS